MQRCRSSAKPMQGLATIALIVDMPELGTMSGKEAASLAGLAPITRESAK